MIFVTRMVENAFDSVVYCRGIALFVQLVCTFKGFAEMRANVDTASQISGLVQIVK